MKLTDTLISWTVLATIAISRPDCLSIGFLKQLLALQRNWERTDIDLHMFTEYTVRTCAAIVTLLQPASDQEL